MKFCSNCGHELRAEARFCPECGKSTKKSEQIEQQERIAESEQHSATNPTEQSTEKKNAEPFLEQHESEKWAESDELEQTENEGQTEIFSGQIELEQGQEETYSPGHQSNQEVHTSGIRQSREKPPVFKSKKSKIITMIVAVFVILLFGSYYTINKVMMSPEAVADSFMDAVQEKDEPKLRAFINDGQLEMDVTKADVESFLEFLDDRPQMITTMSGKLEEDVQQHDAGSDYAVADEGEKSIASLERDGKKWFLFDRYVVNVTPVYMDVTSTEDDTTIFVGDEEAGTVSAEKDKTLGPFLPGIYEVKAAVKGDYGKVEAAQEADFSDVDEGSVNPDFDFADYYVDLYSDNGDATLYVNGESTDKKLDDIEALGPVPKDDSIELFAKKKFSTGVKKSDPVTVGKDTNNADLYLDYDDYDEKHDEKQGEADDKKDKEEALDVINDHYEAITDEDYESAYDLFSADKQNQFNAEEWSKDLADTMKDDVTLTEVDNMEDDTAKVYMEMKSYDEDDDGSVHVKEWEGYWTLVKEDGEWKMNESDLDEVDSWTK